MRTFFHKFVAWFVERYYDTWVKWPETEDELRHCEQLYARQGLPGCIASMDGVHLAWDNTPAPASAQHRGKEGYPTLVFNVCVSHTRRILNVAGAFPGARNDKTTVKVDTFVRAVRTMAVYTEYAFRLLRFTGQQALMKGAWILCDGGYHTWVSTISPYSPPEDEFSSAWTAQ